MKHTPTFIIIMLWLGFWSSHTLVVAQQPTDSIPPYGLRFCNGSIVGVNPPRHAPAFSSIPTNNGLLMGNRLYVGEYPCVKLDNIDWQGRFLKQIDTCFLGYSTPFRAFLRRENDIVFSSRNILPDETNQVYIGRADLNGNIKEIVINAAGFSKKVLAINSIQQLPNKDFVFIGIGGDENFRETRKLFVLHTDSAFNKINHRIFDNHPLGELCYNSCLDYEGNVLIPCYEMSGRLEDLLPDPFFFGIARESYVERPLLYKYNPTTNDIEWTKAGVYMPDSMYADHNEHFGWFIQKYQEGYLTFGTILTPLVYNILYGAGNTDEEAYYTYKDFPVWELSYLNKNFEEIWSVFIDDSADYIFYNPPLVNQQNEIVIAGRRFDIRQNNRYNEPEYSIAVHKFGPSGNNIFSRAYYLQLEKFPFIGGEYLETQLEYIHSAGLHKHPQGGYAAAFDIAFKKWHNNDPNSGYFAFDFEDPIALFWFDENGCIDGGRCAENRMSIPLPAVNDFSHLLWAPLPPDTILPPSGNQLFTLYPNPAQQQGTIALNFEHQNLLLEVFDLLGRKVYTKNIENTQISHTINCQKWTPGVYVVSLKEKNTLLAQKKWVVH